MLAAGGQHVLPDMLKDHAFLPYIPMNREHKVACIKELLGSHSPTGRSQELILALIAPLNDDKVCIYWRPNPYFEQLAEGDAKAADKTARTAASSTVLAHSECLGSSHQPYKEKTKGPISQYIRALVLQQY